MAWQNPAAMVGNGGGPGGDNNGGQPQGTEYTLQGMEDFVISSSHGSIRTRTNHASSYG